MIIEFYTFAIRFFMQVIRWTNTRISQTKHTRILYDFRKIFFNKSIQNRYMMENHYSVVKSNKSEKAK